MSKLNMFFKAGIKTLRRDRFFALVNILGLSLGMFIFLITSLYVRDELTTDRWHENADRIYMPMASMQMGSSGDVAFQPPFAYGEGILEASPGVEEWVSLSRPETKTYEVDGEEFEANNFYFSQPSLLRVFDFELKYGNPESALSEPKSVIISQTLAEKHFGKNENPVGEFIKLDDLGEMKITGVMARMKRNSSLEFDLLVPIDFNLEAYSKLKGNWQFGNGMHYLLLQENYSLDKLKEDTNTLIASHYEEDDHVSYKFSQFSDMYLAGSTWVGRENIFGGQMKYVYIFSLVGTLMLLVACFNYINLTTARSIARSKDMMIRKIVGASKGRIVSLQLGETFFLVLLALVMASIAVEMTLPAINGIIDKKLNLNYLNDPGLLLIPGVLLVLVVVASGIYPALVSSTLNISTLLKGSTPKSSGAMFRKVLVVLQFLICAGLLSSALIIRGQANFLANMDAGYNRKNVMNFDLYQHNLGDKYAEFKAELGRIPQIEMLSGSPMPRINSIMIFPVERDGETHQEFITFGMVDKELIELFELEILEGKSFAELTESELENAVILNEKAVEKLGYDQAIGQEPLGAGRARVVGVVKNFQINNAKNEIGPLILMFGDHDIRHMHIKFREGDRAVVKAQVEKVYESFKTDIPLELEDVETYFANEYARETTLVKIFDILTAMLVIVAFLGLFALSTFENKLREKEMSIRKVLGANYLSLIKTMNRRFILLVLVAMVASVPASYYLISDWLKAFPYRVSDTSSYFIISVTTIVMLAFAILSVHGYRNALKNPADVLRNE